MSAEDPREKGWLDVPPEMRQRVIDTWSARVADAVRESAAETEMPPEKRAWLATFDAASFSAIEYLAAAGGLTADPDRLDRVRRKLTAMH